MNNFYKPRPPYWIPDLCSARKMPSETPGAILFTQKSSNLQDCVMYV